MRQHERCPRRSISPARTGRHLGFSFGNVTDTHGPVQFSLLRDGVDTGMTGELRSRRVAHDRRDHCDGRHGGRHHITTRWSPRTPYGNQSTTAAIVVVIDGGAPSVPGSVRTAAPLTRNAPVISWNASTGQPATYRVFRDGASIGTITAPATTYSDPTLPLDGTVDRVYTYTVAAVDAALNQSAQSAPVQITLDTLGPRRQRPDPRPEPDRGEAGADLARLGERRRRGLQRLPRRREDQRRARGDDELHGCRPRW